MRIMPDEFGERLEIKLLRGVAGGRHPCTAQPRCRATVRNPQCLPGAVVIDALFRMPFDHGCRSACFVSRMIGRTPAHSGQARCGPATRQPTQCETVRRDAKRRPAQGAVCSTHASHMRRSLQGLSPAPASTPSADKSLSWCRPIPRRFRLLHWRQRRRRHARFQPAGRARLRPFSRMTRFPFSVLTLEREPVAYAQLIV